MKIEKSLSIESYLNRNYQNRNSFYKNNVTQKAVNFSTDLDEGATHQDFTFDENNEEEAKENNETLKEFLSEEKLEIEIKNEEPLNIDEHKNNDFLMKENDKLDNFSEKEHIKVNVIA